MGGFTFSTVFMFLVFIADLKKSDVVFLIDGSYDSRNGFEQIRGFIGKMVDSLNIDDNRDQVAVVQFSRDATVNFYLNSYSSKNDVLNSIRTMRHKFGRPLNTGKALEFVRDNVFGTSVGGRHTDMVPQYLYVFSGGRSGDDVRGPAQSLKEKGIKTFSIGTQNADTLEMQTISSTPAHYFPVTNFNNLQSLHARVEAALSGAQETTEFPSVIGKMSTTNERQIWEFVGEFVKQLEIGPSRVQVALTQYSTRPTTNFLLNTYSLKDDILNHLRGAELTGGQSVNTGEALDYVTNNVFTSSSGSRILQGIPQILILLSGMKSADDVSGPVERLRDAGIVLFSVGMNNADSLEMDRLAQSPQMKYFVNQMSDLMLVKQQLLSVKLNMSHVLCSLAERQPTGRDVVFLLDGSDGTRTEFPAVRDFVQRMVDTLSVDDSRDRVAVVQYSRDAAVQFYLNTYTTKAEILDTVRGLRHKGGRPLYTGAALQYVRDNVFTASAGSRRLEGVPQVLILLSGARSVDSVDAPASALKQLGVLTFAIGTRNADKREMQKIAHEPTHAVSVSEFNDLPNVQQQLQSSVEAVIVEGRDQGKVLLFDLSSCLSSVDAPKKDIVFLLDGSDATRNGFPAMRDFVERVVEKLNVGENKDRVSVVQYSREPEVHFYLNTYNTRADIVDTVRGLRHRGGRTLNTGAALQYVRDNVFTNSSGSRRLQGVPQMLILLNGGRSYDNVDAPASALKQQGIVVIGIGAGRADSAEMQKISSDPTYALSVSELTDLPSLKCVNVDVVFLLDGSDGTRTEFPAVRDFVQRMVDTLSVDDSRDRVAVVQYSRDAAVQFYLNTYTTKAEILDTVRGLRHKGGRPLYTGAALQYVRDNVFTASAGSRRLEGVPQVLILLSGARSVDSVDAPASALKQLGVLTFAIGTRNADKREMQKIAHEPTHAVSVFEFNDLPNVQQQLQKVLLFDLSSCLSSVDAPKKDIVFLLDGSDATRNGFPAMRDFVERVVEKLNVGENKDRVSVVQYSREPEVHFYLNTYNTRADIVDTVRGLRHRGGRTLNTGAALQYVRDNVFTNSSGSRRLQGVPQMLILLNGGRSYDNVDAPASALKQQGIVVIGIGAGRADSAEMQKISSDPTYALSLNMSHVLCSLAERQPTGRDVVFLLDGSDGTRTEFPAVRDFVQRMVDTLSVDDSRDRVAVVQYSRDAAVQFYLNTYTTKAEILDTVRGLRHKGGRPLYTGAALQYVRDNVFTASAGSRRLEGVPQVLILLSGARSVDSVDAPASALKQLGVLTFAIGTRNADKREMQKIAHEPTHAVSVSEFNDLPNVQQQLQSSVEAVIVEVTPETPTAPGTLPSAEVLQLILWTRSEGTTSLQTPPGVGACKAFHRC
uniref:VWFA domain-containing protein n=1 Tax=Sphaeramia orbicularis TaxID=375764 RepID=A0A673B2A2_9TELE